MGPDGSAGAGLHAGAPKRPAAGGAPSGPLPTLGPARGPAMEHSLLAPRDENRLSAPCALDDSSTTPIHVVAIMPTYEYRREDGTTFEIQQRITEDPLETCPETGQQVERIISGGSGLIFKGEGFYVNDYGKGASNGSSASNGAAEASSSDDAASTESSAPSDDADS